jgi:hypothetical protein
MAGIDGGGDISCGESTLMSVATASRERVSEMCVKGES